MRTIKEKIYRELTKRKTNWDNIEKYIQNMGDAINMLYEYEESILSALYKCHLRKGDVNERLTDLFLKHGFDVSANEGRNGASCLHALCWSSYDRYILPIAEKLLDAGADSTIAYDEKDKEDDDMGVLSSISWKFGSWHTGDYESANMFVAYYEMVDRHQKGKAYKGIRAFRDSVGEAVSKVELMKVYDVRGNVRTSYLLSCGEKELVVSDYVEFIVNPYAREEAIEIRDVSDEYRCLIGAKVKGLRYYNDSLAKLSFDNGYALLVGANGVTEATELKAWFRIVATGYSKLPVVGSEIESVKIWGDRRHSDTSTFYDETTIVLCMENFAFALYAHKVRYGKSTVRAERVSIELVSDMKRSIDIHNISLKHVEYIGDAVQWLSIRCDEGILYVVTNGFDEVALFLSDKEIEPEDVPHVRHFSDGLKKIRFVEKN